MTAPWERPEEAEQPKEAALAPWEKPKAEARAPWDKPQADELGRFVAGKEPESSKPDGIIDMLGRGIVRGAKQTGSALFDVLPAMAASAVGADEYARKQMQEAEQTQREIEQKYGARYKQLSDVKGVGDYVPFALETVAEQVPNLLTALVPGVGGGALAARGVTGLAAKEAAKRIAIGQGVGTYLGSYALNAPEIFQNIYQETGGQLEPGAAILAGSVSAALDSVLPATLLNRLTPGAKAGIVEKLLEKSGMKPGIARAAVGTAITGAAEEAPTEAAQEAISIFAEKFVQDHPEAWGSKEFNRIVESGVRGAVGGGGFGGITGGAQGYLEKRAARKEATQLDQDRAEVFTKDFVETQGREPTEQEVANFVNVAKELSKETEGEDTGTDTGAGKSGISMPGKEPSIAAGLSTTDTGRVERTESTAGGTEVREEVQPSPLDNKTQDELLEIKKNYEVEQQSMLYKNGKEPRQGTKRREEYDALQTRIDDINSRIQQIAPTQTQATEADFKGLTTEEIQQKHLELTNAWYEINSQRSKLRQEGNEFAADKLLAQQMEIDRQQYELNKELESRQKTAPSEETTTQEVLKEEAPVAELPSRESFIDEHVPEQHKEKARAYLDAFTQYENASKDMPEWPAKPTEEQKQKFAEAANAHDAALNALPKEEQSLLSNSFKASTPEERQAIVGAYKQAVAPTEVKTKKKRKSKKEIDEVLDNLEDHPDRLTFDDLDNLFADPLVTKQENTSPKADQVPLDDPLFSTAHPSVTRAINQNDIKGTLQALKNTGGKFLSALAERLMDLGLTTTLGWDDVQYDLAMAGLKAVDGQKNRIIKWIQQIYPEVYRNKFDESKMKQPVTELLQSFQELRDGKLGIPPGMFTEDLKDVIDIYEKTYKTLNSPGTYFTRYNAIGLSLTTGGNSNYVISHELTHAATHWAIDNPGKLTPEQQVALGKLEGLYEFAKKNTKNPSAYGYNNLHEFVAEAFSRPEFQKELRAMKASMETNMSAWSKFIQLVARLIGIDNVLFHTLANADILFSARSNSEVTNGADLLWSASRYDVRDGKFTLNPGERTKWLTGIIKNRTKWKDLDKTNIKQFFTSLNNQYRKYLFGAISVDQLADIYGDNMPQLKLYVKEVDAMIATRNAILKEGDPIITKWSNLINVNPQKSEQLGKTMIEATLKKIDPDPKSIGYDSAVMQKEPELKAAWQELASGKDGGVAVEIYRQVREFYERRMNEYVQVQLQRIEESGKVKGLSDQEIDKKKLDFKKATEEKIIRPYFPIKRFGEYFLMVGQGQKKIFLQFEDAFARDEEMRKQKEKLIKSGATAEEADRMLWPGQGFNEVLNQKLNDISQLNKIYEMIDSTADGVMQSAASDPAVAANEIGAFQQELKDQFGQYYLELLPSESIKKMFLHRENVAGPSQDMLRAFGLSRERIAYQRARFQHMPALFNIIEASKMRLKTMPTPQEKAIYGDVSNELAKQFKEGVLEPPKQNKLTTYLTHFGFLNFLTSPASAVVNMMAIPGLYIPVAGARYGGVKKVGRVVTKYTRMLGGTGYVNADTGRYEFLSLARANLQDQTTFVTKDGKTISLPKGRSLADVYAFGVNRNVIDTTLVHDSVAIGEHPSADYTGRWQKFMYYASLPFHAAEKFNREVSFMTSFELAYEKQIKNKTPEKAFEAAVDEARDLTQETMFNYNTTNKPRYFRGNAASVLLQFKMYPQNLTMLMFRTFYKAIGQNSKVELRVLEQELINDKVPEQVAKEILDAKRAELKEMQKQARDAFLGMMGMSFLTAGATGMPLWFIFSGIASAFNAVFGDDDDFDPENWFKNWAERTFGGFVGGSISRGLVSQATGMNFADRMNVNLPDLWFPDVRKGTDETDYAKNMFINLMGPSVGALVVNYPEALKRFNDGYTDRAMEAMMPAAIKNVLVGARYLSEGEATSIKGNLIQEVNPGEALAQMLGFSPESVAQAQKAAIEAKNVNETIKRKHTDLLNAFFIAADGGDYDMIEKVMEKIMDYNMKYPELAIDGKALKNSMTKRYKDRALADITGGIGIDKKLIPRLYPMLEYGQD